MSTVGIQRTTDGVLQNADTALLTIQNSAGSVLVSSVIVAPASTGVYSYDVTSFTPGRYTATWTFQVAGQQDDVVTRQFNIDASVSGYRGQRLMDIEQAVARRIGPFLRGKAMTAGTTASVRIRRLMSSIDTGDWEDMYILRRGILQSGALIPGFNTEDRVRVVATYVHDTGSLVPDADWIVAPVENELIELHMLEPEEELRPCVQKGLSRCYFWDTIEIATTTYLRDLLLSDVAPWVTRPEQVGRVTYGRFGYLDMKAPFFETYQLGSGIYLKTAIPALGTMRILAMRPHSTFVNDEVSLTGPDNDMDILHVDARYAMIAGHISCWEDYPAKLQPVAVDNLAVPRELVASEFTVRSQAICKQYPDVIQNHFGQSDIWDNLQLGNG